MPDERMLNLSYFFIPFSLEDEAALRAFTEGLEKSGNWKLEALAMDYILQYVADKLQKKAGSDQQDKEKSQCLHYVPGACAHDNYGFPRPDAWCRTKKGIRV